MQRERGPGAPPLGGGAEAVSRSRRISAYLLLAAAFVLTGWFSHVLYNGRSSGPHLRRVTAKGYALTNPLLDVELPEGVIINQEPIPFKGKIESLIQRQINAGNVGAVSVYYRDLHDGPWFGINEEREFNPASMMKIAVLIAWLKRAERDPGVLKSRLLYDGRVDMTLGQAIKPRATLTAGRSYTVEELLEYMISYSDNNATSLLYPALGGDELGAVMDGMDVNNKVKGDENSITVHGYSGFFRILYNASYLNRAMSEKALDLLSRQDFQGIVAGVPEGIRVASKFGEYWRGELGGEFQLHEFGIVYHPKHPYILGIMTVGTDCAKQIEVLREISRAVYAEVETDILSRGMR